jgi:hypothetical protein
MYFKIWSPYPLYSVIIEILEKKGSLTDGELFDLVKKSYESVGFGQLNKTLMRMEIEGKIHVSLLTKGRRRVELIENKKGGR